MLAGGTELARDTVVPVQAPNLSEPATVETDATSNAICEPERQIWEPDEELSQTVPSSETLYSPSTPTDTERMGDVARLLDNTKRSTSPVDKRAIKTVGRKAS